MEKTMSIHAEQESKIRQVLVWWPVIAGLLALYVPTYLGLLDFAWKGQDQAHGPIVLLVVLFLFWQKREWFINPPQESTQPILGALCLGFGLLCYVLGRSQDIVMLDLGSQIPVVAGVILITRGFPALKAMWFPLFFTVFMLPLPLDALTLPMKMAVSYVTETILFWLDYPIARSGVILQIGQYQLLVADACAGMHTLISLEALGLLYLNLVKHDSATRNIVLAALIVPISFTANVIRVITLTLITYYLGDEIGQGFVHGFAGMLLFIVALTIIMSVDSLIQYFVQRQQKSST
jgi:exosortase B